MGGGSSSCVSFFFWSLTHALAVEGWPVVFFFLFFFNAGTIVWCAPPAPPPLPVVLSFKFPIPIPFFPYIITRPIRLKRIYCLFFLSFFFQYFFNVRCFCFFSRASCRARIGSLSSRDFISFSGETPVMYSSMQGRERILRKEWGEGSLLVRELS